MANLKMLLLYTYMLYTKILGENCIFYILDLRPRTVYYQNITWWQKLTIHTNRLLTVTVTVSPGVRENIKLLPLNPTMPWELSINIVWRNCYIQAVNVCWLFVAKNATKTKWVINQGWNISWILVPLWVVIFNHITVWKVKEVFKDQALAK